ncbi:MAG: EamA family transporter RarD, partial [Gammaproteobacteria bacterium]|nr:EamA family transporter RarD [Gammaproteobacteria bacterium]
MSVGVVLSVLASMLFGGLYYFSTLLTPLNGEQIFGWRMLLTFPCITLFMLWFGYWP